MILFYLTVLALFCISASAEKLELPPLADYSKLSIEELLEKASSLPGLEYLKNNETMAAMGITATNIHPDVLEDSMLLTVIITMNMHNILKLIAKLP